MAGVLAARGRAAVASAAPCAAVTAHPIRDARHSRFAVSILRGGSLRDMSSMPRASAHDFKLPLVGASPPPAAVLRMPFSEMIADRGLHWCAGGGEKSLGDYKGKVVLIENVASL